MNNRCLWPLGRVRWGRHRRNLFVVPPAQEHTVRNSPVQYLVCAHHHRHGGLLAVEIEPEALSQGGAREAQHRARMTLCTEVLLYYRYCTFLLYGLGAGGSGERGGAGLPGQVRPVRLSEWPTILAASPAQRAFLAGKGDLPIS
jgi:hypothetical protein